jgi:hypothetical protein
MICLEVCFKKNVLKNYEKKSGSGVSSGSGWVVVVSK